MNATIERFGYPDTLIREYESWVVLLRVPQVTLGSLVLACKGEATSLSGVAAEAFAELRVVTDAIESVLADAYAYDKINYLALMMVDPHVHFHVIPRYDGEREAVGVTFVDAAWPGPPDLRTAPELDEQAVGALVADLSSRWPG